MSIYIYLGATRASGGHVRVGGAACCGAREGLCVRVMRAARNSDTRQDASLTKRSTNLACGLTFT